MLTEEQRAKFDRVCDLIASTDLGVKNICKGDDAPVSESTFHRWLHDDETGELEKQYRRAKQIQADRFAEEILEIADDGTNDWMERRDKDGKCVGYELNGEHVQRSRLRIDSRKWLAAKLYPKVYGDKLEVEQTGGVGDMDIAAIRAELKQLSDLFGFQLPPRLLGEKDGSDEAPDGD